MTEFLDDETDASGEVPEETVKENYETLAHGILSPRHRRLALLFAQGKSSKEVGEELGYTSAWVSTLKKNPHIALEIQKITDRIYEETVQARLKTMIEPALQNVQLILTDRTNKVKVSERMEMSKWVLEKVDGKASQKLDIGENMLGVFFDRLDSLEASGKNLSSPPRTVTEETGPPDLEHQALPPAPARAKTREEELAEWADDFMRQG